MYKFTVILCTESNENTEIHVGVIYMSDTWKDYVQFINNEIILLCMASLVWPL